MKPAAAVATFGIMAGVVMAALNLAVAKKIEYRFNVPWKDLILATSLFAAGAGAAYLIVEGKSIFPTKVLI